MKGGYRVEVSLIFKIAAVGILVSVISQILKHSGREEHAFCRTYSCSFLDCAIYI